MFVDKSVRLGLTLLAQTLRLCKRCSGSWHCCSTGTIATGIDINASFPNALIIFSKKFSSSSSLERLLELMPSRTLDTVEWRRCEQCVR